MTANRIEDESFMLACLKMAKSYIRIVRGELDLYRSRTGHKPVETNFSALTKAIDERIELHSAKLEQARQPAKPKVKLKQRGAGGWRCGECGGDTETGHQRLCKTLYPKVHKVKLKKRAV